MEPVSIRESSAARTDAMTSSQNSAIAEASGPVSGPVISTATAPPAKAESGGAIEKWLLRRLLSAIGNPPLVFVLWNGEEIVGEAALREGAARIRVHDRATLWRILFDPFFQFPEAYTNGKLEIDGDLEQVMCLVAHSAAEAAPVATRWLTLVEKALHWGGRTTMAASQKNIHHHYDIGNDFYRLWLDENLLYTCAYFEDPGASLEAAQIAKMDHVCRKVVLQPGDTVIEAGCGWGGFALHMARHYGVRVRAYNISKEQVSEARSRAKAEGLDDRVEFILDDWRNITGKCDVFMSIGMLEHVGLTNYRQLGDVIDRCLSPNGRGLIHSIGRNRHEVLDPWIERRIFPGAQPPSLSEMGAIFEPHQFSILEVENLRMHYAETLRHWLSRYEQSVETVRKMYDARFVRMWRMYLAGSIAAFDSGTLQLFQVLFARPRLNDLPLTRAHQYTHLASRDGQPACSGPVRPALSWEER
ncbi:MAG TPA: cyclopropane-fatty-acyl-phospholipid synthase family protein [Planctomycetaceae bacterium]|jgi:cyclopropane-fatty-acyl-phospholipid synthase|nr:cyclopropane-fatty-acyl-phospholipid synthase family protein [Planctomycetaceae bacterium]